MTGRYELTDVELQEFFVQKYGNPEDTGWSPRRRHKFGYFLAGDIYEALVAKLVTPTTNWVDIGGGSALFPNNPDLSQELADRCEFLVSVDPSPNIDKNPYCDESEMCFFEEYSSERKFDLATFRMVAEHVDDPSAVMNKLEEVMAPNGLVVIYTINKYCPVPIVTKLTPFSWHTKLKNLMLWRVEEEDTFPVAYKMNTRKSLKDFFEGHGFVEDNFRYPDDLSVFLNFKVLNYLELRLWQLLKRFNIKYPEHNLLGVYRRQP